MTPSSIREYVAAQRQRYHGASRPAKGRLLDEVVAVTGYHRKAAIRVLAGTTRSERGRRGGARGRPRCYGPAVASAAQVLWEAAGQIGAKRLQPFVPELLDRLIACGELALAPAVDALLRQVSPATLERLLAPARVRLPRRGRSTTRAGTLLKHQIPVRTFADWDDARPGFLEVDLVAHCGESTEGFYLTTLVSVDIASTWVELEAVWGKGQQRVGAAVHQTRRRLPVPLLGLDSDSGSEFINHGLYGYCQREGITFTRSRANKKNDQAHVEQKNGALVRSWVGYDRYASKAAYAHLAQVYRLLRLHANFFQPTQKLLRKTREGTTVRRVYDRAQTPYQRLLAAGVLDPATQQELATVYARLNPLQLKRQLDAALEKLWPMAARTITDADHAASATPVTGNGEAPSTLGNHYL